MNTIKLHFNAFTHVVTFAGGKLCENVGKTFQYFTYFINKVLWVLFSRGRNIRLGGNIAKNAKIFPTRKCPREQ